MCGRVWAAGEESDLRPVQAATAKGGLRVERANAEYRKEVSTDRADLPVLLWATARDAVLVAGLSHSVCAHKARAKVPATGPPQRVPRFDINRLIIDLRYITVVL